MVKKLALSLVMLLSACIRTEPSPCVNPGIDFFYPNFHVNHNANQLNAYYACVYQSADGFYADEPFISYRGLDAREYLKQDAQYQSNLWRQIQAKLKLPLEAEQLWIEYSAAQKNSRDQIDASRRAAAAASSAAYSLDRERYEREKDKKKKSFSDTQTMVRDYPCVAFHGEPSYARRG